MRVDASTVESAWRERLVARFGPGVLGWLTTLPDRVSALAAAWELRLGGPFATGGTSRVLAVTRADGSAAVLKLSPDPALIAQEALALDAWAAPRILERAPDALLLERVVPGDRLRDRPGPPPAAGEIAALVARLHVSPPPGVVGLAERLRRAYAGSAADPALVARGLHAALELAADHPGPPVLLHGDLHPGNVLTSAGGGLVAVDPRPCAGDPAFDLVAWVAGGGDPNDEARDLGEAAGIEPERLLRWLRAAAVLL